MELCKNQRKSFKELINTFFKHFTVGLFNISTDVFIEIVVHLQPTLQLFKPLLMTLQYSLMKNVILRGEKRGNALRSITTWLLCFVCNAAFPSLRLCRRPLSSYTSPYPCHATGMNHISVLLGRERHTHKCTHAATHTCMHAAQSISNSPHSIHLSAFAATWGQNCQLQNKNISTSYSFQPTSSTIRVRYQQAKCIVWHRSSSAPVSAMRGHTPL